MHCQYICKQCRAPFTRPPSKRPPTYCSRACASAVASAASQAKAAARRASQSPQMCAVVGCGKLMRRHSAVRPWCDQHYQRWRDYGRADEPSHLPLRYPCWVEGCTTQSTERGLCIKHHRRWKRYGSVETVKLRRGLPRTYRPDGYVHVRWPGHANANAAGWVLEHRLVMGEMLGRSLLPEENVHHKNGDRSDNSPENLELWVSMQPSGQRAEDLVAWARTILERYESFVETASEQGNGGSPGGAESVPDALCGVAVGRLDSC